MWGAESFGWDQSWETRGHLEPPLVCRPPLTISVGRLLLQGPLRITTPSLHSSVSSWRLARVCDQRTLRLHRFSSNSVSPSSFSDPSSPAPPPLYPISRISSWSRSESLLFEWKVWPNELIHCRIYFVLTELSWTRNLWFLMVAHSTKGLIFLCRLLGAFDTC